MKYIKVMWPFVAVYLLLTNILPVSAWLLGVPFTDYNQQLEGGRISSKVLSNHTSFPAEMDVFFAGTSRTMADVSPKIFSSRISEKTGIKNIKAYNLGNLGYQTKILEGIVDMKSPPTFLIIEDGAGIATSNDFIKTRYLTYNRSIQIFELFVTGYLKKLTYSKAMFKLDNNFFAAAKKTLVDRSMSWVDFYYYNYCAINGLGQKIQDDGQSYYRSYFKNREMAESCQFMNTHNVSVKLLDVPGVMSDERWESFLRLVEFYRKNGQLIVYRPPMSPELYELQMRKNGPILKKLSEFYRENNIPFIDMNPHHFFGSDYSHLDWYDTREFSTELADRLLEVMDRQLLEKISRKHTSGAGADSGNQ